MNGRHRFRRFAPVLRRPGGLFGVAAVTALVVAGGVSAWWTPHDPLATDPRQAWLLPLRGGHLLGTDRVGHDVFSQLLAGAWQTLVVAVLVAVIAGTLGLTLALAANSVLPPVAAPAAELIGVGVAFPALLLAMILVAVYGGSLLTVALAIGISSGMAVARVMRAEVARVLASDYVLAARAAGASAARIARTHVLPGIRPTLIVQLSTMMALAVLAEAALTYLGYGSSPSAPSWGSILREQQEYIRIRPLLVIWPGLAVAGTVLGFNLLGDALRAAFDVRLREDARSR
ncbi:ABC transporter permease [Nocardia panacis]|uniref:ABC transporter permease n=1 Tax=Nocardia panacis TaxID=2340916 RepID=UPI001EF06ECB|nr:ABC transporter permease [Nocardia panacis]